MHATLPTPLRAGLPALLALGALALPARSQDASSQPQNAFSLIQAVPDDVFLVTASRYNPERDFLHAYWYEVWLAFEESGVIDEVTDLVLSLAEEEVAAELSRVCERFCGLCAEVDWLGMGRGEVVFAERILGPTTWGDHGFTVMPDMVMLVRTDAETTEANYGALAAILAAAVEEINAASGMELELREVESDAFRSTVFDLVQIPDAPSIALSVGATEDVLVMAFGHGIGGEVFGLLTGQEGASIADNPRLRAALAALPPAEDGFEFFDVQALAAGLDRVGDGLFDMLDQQLAHHGDESGGQATAPARAIVDRLIDSLGVIQYSATTHQTDGHSVYSDSVTALAPDAASNPIYPVVTGGAPVTQFARYIPKETTSYSVNGGFDLGALYTYVEETVLLAGEKGEHVLALWEGFQEEQGFDIHEDVLGWIEGSGVSAEFEVDGKDAWILMVRVTDEDTANEKIAWVLQAVPAFVDQVAAEQPMLAMFKPTVTPSDREGLEGFHEIAVGAMLPRPLAIGVRDAWMIVGSSADAVLVSQATAAGTHPSVRENEALMGRAIVPGEEVGSASFTDHAGTAEEIAGMLRGFSMMGGMIAANIPDPDGQKVVSSLCKMLGRLAPVVEAIDFYSASSAVTTFDGKAWKSSSVTHYVPPPEGDEGEEGSPR